MTDQEFCKQRGPFSVDKHAKHRVNDKSGRAILYVCYAKPPYPEYTDFEEVAEHVASVLNKSSQ